jgi:hypothetical protein
MPATTPVRAVCGTPDRRRQRRTAGVVGPTGMRPKTAWEIHPVTRIEFETGS